MVFCRSVSVLSWSSSSISSIVLLPSDLLFRRCLPYRHSQHRPASYLLRIPLLPLVFSNQESTVQYLSDEFFYHLGRMQIKSLLIRYCDLSLVTVKGWGHLDKITHLRLPFCVLSSMDDASVFLLADRLKSLDLQGSTLTQVSDEVWCHFTSRVNKVRWRWSSDYITTAIESV